MQQCKRILTYETKICVVCNELKNLKENFRVVNVINGYTSKTCRDCEQTKIADPLFDIKKSEGNLYLLFDSVFPEYIKFGYTRNHIRRLCDYNKTRPLDTCHYLYLSNKMTDIFNLEQKILTRIYRYTYNAADRPEWFSIDYKEKIIKEIQLIENEFLAAAK